ncbi:transporter substrate-binding domain-containing protein [Shimia sp.]|uniref:transporter substrate-binding domain-containing protein n=1 Tax=Shimia sp. TaxID=1954381 RepID=UPI003B8B3885
MVFWDKSLHLIGGVMCFVASSFPVGAQENTKLRVGVRVDAAPFAWKDDANEFNGLIYDFCRIALENADLEYGLADATVANRLDRLVAQGSTPRTYDILCGPTSITISRSQKYFLSPPIFVSGGSFIASGGAFGRFHQAAIARLAEREEDGLPVIGPDGTEIQGASRDEKIRSVRQESIPECDQIDTETQIVGARLGYVQGTTGRNVIDQAWLAEAPPVKVAAFQTICAEAQLNHEIAVERLCDGAITHHFGDRDIVEYYLTQGIGTSFPACDAKASSEFYTAEPYAIAISPELDGATVRQFISGILEVMGSGVRSDTGDDTIIPLTDHLFSRTFKAREMGATLRELYTILRVPKQ